MFDNAAFSLRPSKKQSYIEGHQLFAASPIVELASWTSFQHQRHQLRHSNTSCRGPEGLRDHTKLGHWTHPDLQWVGRQAGRLDRMEQSTLADIETFIYNWQRRRTLPKYPLLPLLHYVQAGLGSACVTKAIVLASSSTWSGPRPRETWSVLVRLLRGESR